MPSAYSGRTWDDLVVGQEFWTGARTVTEGDVLAFALGLEEGAASAYLSTIPGFENRDLAKAAASIMGVETQHVAILKNALGQKPIEAPFIM